MLYEYSIYILTLLTPSNSDIYKLIVNLRMCYCAKVRDVRTKINNGTDSELNILNCEFLRNNLQFSVFNQQLFSEN